MGEISLDTFEPYDAGLRQVAKDNGCGVENASYIGFVKMQQDFGVSGTNGAKDKANLGAGFGADGGGVEGEVAGGGDDDAEVAVAGRAHLREGDPPDLQAGTGAWALGEFEAFGNG